ncbi:hypothetical protein [Nitrospira lenta]|uniref:DUF4412 domain-containing protein n=1 Tax=Nitrospira lenta TaxID=1436998 RepID=A0A330L4U0_9BACT|nr:hypothetical protein [Nitrospira lenta]SPP64217.1 conserved exported hypothetical protein [Nitrospira lenta]
MTPARLAMLLVIGMLLPSAAMAASPVRESHVEYSADSTMESDGGMSMKSRVYHTPDKDRTEMGGADGSIMIMRRDKNVMWQLFGDMYMELPLAQSNAGGMEDLEILEQKDVGEETINGIKTTKSKIIAVKKDGNKFGGFFWTSREGITVRMDLLSKEGDKKIRMFSELTNLKIGKQDPALFEIPAGYTKNDMGAMMGQGGMPNLDEMMKNAGDERPKEKRPAKESSRSKPAESDSPVDMNKMLKGIFGR